MKNETKLLNCPFCGGEAIMFQDSDGYYVSCKNDCVVQLKSFLESEAIKAWNARKPMERILERLEEEPYINKGGELFLNGDNEDCLPLRKFFEIVKEEGGIE